MTAELKSLTAKIVASYVASNAVSESDLPNLIGSVFAALSSAGQPEPVPEAAATSKPTAAQIRRSVTTDALISFLDGKPYKMLKRHLALMGHTPASYRAAFGLPHDYPMTAPSYSASRSELAKAIGLGSRGKRGAPAKKAAAKRGGMKKG